MIIFQTKRWSGLAGGLIPLAIALVFSESMVSGQVAEIDPRLLPKPVVAPADVTVLRGAKQTFVCTYKVPANATYLRVSWYRNKLMGQEPDLMWNTENTPGIATISTAFGNYKTSKKLIGASADNFSALHTSHSLTFTDVQPDDNLLLTFQNKGQYVCEVAYGIIIKKGSQVTDVREKSANVTMTVNDLPKPELKAFSDGKPSDLFREGEAVYVDCMTPHPTPANVRLTVFKRLTAIPCTQTHEAKMDVCRSLVMFNREDNAAEWFCQASWQKKLFDSKKIPIAVSFFPKTLTMTQSFPAAEVAIESTVVLSCKTDSGNPTPIIRWTRNGNTIVDGSIGVTNKTGKEVRYSMTSSTVVGAFAAKYSVAHLSFNVSMENYGATFECYLQNPNIKRSSKLLVEMPTNTKKPIPTPGTIHPTRNNLVPRTPKPAEKKPAIMPKEKPKPRLVKTKTKEGARGAKVQRKKAANDPETQLAHDDHASSSRQAVPVFGGSLFLMQVEAFLATNHGLAISSGVGAGTLLVAVSVIVAAVLVSRRRRKDRENQELKEAECEELEID